MNKAFGAGIITPVSTPINPDESVNYDQLAKLLEHIIAGGVDAVFVMGSTGEFARFPVETRDKVIAETVRLVKGRIPVYAGVSDAGLTSAKRNLAAAEKAGADVVVATPPYYYPTRNDNEAVAFFSALAKSTALPLMLYNIPSTCGASISQTAIERLSEHVNIKGIKDSSGDAANLDELLRRRHGKGRDFAIVVGAEELLYHGLANGADGLVPSLSNPFPKLFADLYRAARGKDLTRLEKLCGIVDDMNRINSFSDSWMSANVWRKKALSHLGICNEYCTAPYLPVDEAADKKVREAIALYQEMYGKQ